jgi:hypothetical protein
MGSLGPGLLAAPVLLLAFIHPSAWKECSPKSRCRIAHGPDPMELGKSATPGPSMVVNTPCVSPAWISALVNGTGERRRR